MTQTDNDALVRELEAIRFGRTTNYDLIQETCRLAIAALRSPAPVVDRPARRWDNETKTFVNPAEATRPQPAQDELPPEVQAIVDAATTGFRDDLQRIMAPAQDEVEVVGMAIAEALYGPKFDPFLNPRSAGVQHRACHRRHHRPSPA